MPYKTLTVSEEAYRLLANLKRKGESFTDVIIRIGKENTSLDDLFGALDDPEFEKGALEARRRGNLEGRRRLKRLGV